MLVYSHEMPTSFITKFSMYGIIDKRAAEGTSFTPILLGPQYTSFEAS
jgi:hypothetical protein